MIRFRAGGGRPPQSHEVLLVDGDGAWYVTGMPWPRQPPFDEIGAYRGEVGGGLEEPARTAASQPDAPGEGPDAGYEGVRAGDAEARWSPDERPRAAAAFVAAATTAIEELRRRPWAAVRGRLRGGRLELVNPGSHTIELGEGEVHVGFGRPDRPPSPLRLVTEPATTLGLPSQLEPGVTRTFAIPDPGAPRPDYPDHDAVYALVHLPFRSPVEGEDGGWVDGWLVCGPADLPAP